MTRKRTRDYAVATLLDLPPELCAIICDLVDRYALRQLSRVSKSFRDQAQRLLFQDVDLRGKSSDGVSSWTRALTRNPKLGGHLRRLALGSDEISHAGDDAAKIARALQKCPNLKQLVVGSPFGDTMADRHTWIIDQGTFRLTHFTNGHFSHSFLHSFWNKQTSIRMLSFLRAFDTYSGFPCRDDQLPNLVALEVPTTKWLPTNPRPLQRIQIRIEKHWAERDFARLGLFAATLTTVNLCQPSFYDVARTVEQIAEAVPNLRHLGLTERLPTADELRYRDFVFPLSPQPAPRLEPPRLKCLETLVLYMYHIHHLVDQRHNRLHPMSEPASVAALFMEMAPQLTEVVVGAYEEDIHGERHEKTYKVMRCRESGRLTEEFGFKYDFAAVSRFEDV
uniref:F-box domain-containing protein n=1 Tax=Mycena chlorophos TaxID=658473 RepID=A0ABQ0L920_MYCCL|nr:predicted protein [Mycena chlorophos]